MSTATPLDILSAGMITPVGEDRVSSCAALRAGIGAVALQKRFLLKGPDPEWDAPEPLRAARVPPISLEISGRERLFRLAMTALSEAIRSAGIARRELKETVLLLGLPSGDDAVESWNLDAFSNELLDRTGLSDFAGTEQLRSGHTTALELFARASELITSGSARRAVVVVADTYLGHDRVATLDAHGRFAKKSVPEGFNAGEAGVAIVVQGTSRKRPTRDAPPLAAISALGMGHEPDSAFSERAPSGKGIETAILGASADEHASRAVEWVLCDMNGEPFRAADWGAAASRLGPRISPELTLVHPADLIGDVGCASGALLTAMAVDALSRGYASADRAYVLTSSDGGARAAVKICLWTGA
jgi:3-oxoacyl-[acyl-carrier-protein] synthase-1